MVAVGYNGVGQCDVSSWKDMKAVVTSKDAAYTIGIKANGTVVYAGHSKLGRQISNWTNIKLPAKS